VHGADPIGMEENPLMTLDPQVLSDKAELRDLVQAYAHTVDRRQQDQTAALFVENSHFLIHYGDPETTPVGWESHGREQIERSMHGVDRYVVTTHFIGQHSVEIDGDEATGETYCLAHHVTQEEDGQTMMIMSIRYLDRYVRTGDGWRFQTRRLAADWRVTYPMN
jgi:hypothetical protein